MWNTWFSLPRSGQVRVFNVHIQNKLSWAQVPAFTGSSVRDRILYPGLGQFLYNRVSVNEIIKYKQNKQTRKQKNKQKTTTKTAAT